MNSNLSRHPDHAAPPSASAPSQIDVPVRWADSRLCRHADYQRVYAVARKQFSASMAWFAALRVPADAAPARIGLTVGKVLGKAHERNRIKRRLRAIIARHRALLPAGLDLVLHPRRTALAAPSEQIAEEIAGIFAAAASAALHHPDRLVKRPSAVPEPQRARRGARSQPSPRPAPRASTQELSATVRGSTGAER